MIVFITGSSASGKSAFSEDKARELFHRKGEGGLYYIATMKNQDNESWQRIKKHQEMRAGKGFITVEQPDSLNQLSIIPGSTLLLECLSNLLANEMFADGQVIADAGEKILSDIKALLSRCEHLVIVSNEIFSDGIGYDNQTVDYIKKLGWLNTHLAAIADQVIEIVYGIPIIHKEVPDDGIQ